MPGPREVHGIPEIPANTNTSMRSALTQIRNVVVRLQGKREPAIGVTNLRVTPIGFGNIVDFTRSNGDSYTLYWSLSANSAQASPIPIGQQSRYTHNVGKDGVKVYYWIQTIKDNGSNSKLVGPKNGTTLVSNAAVTVPTPPPSSSSPSTDITTGRPTSGGSNRGTL